jgi:hypothetical protein
MKIKYSFVTNSSSSSFIVLFDKKIDTEDLLYLKEKILFIEKAECVFNGCLNQKPILVNEENYKEAYKRVFQEITSGYFPGHVSAYDLKEYRKIDFSEIAFNTNEGKKKYHEIMDQLNEEADKINNKKAKELTDKFMEKAKDQWIYIFSYCDNDGEFFSEMEHGDTFRKFEHLQISHH